MKGGGNPPAQMGGDPGGLNLLKSTFGGKEEMFCWEQDEWSFVCRAEIKIARQRESEEKKGKKYAAKKKKKRVIPRVVADKAKGGELDCPKKGG